MAHGVFGPAIIVKFEAPSSSTTAAEKFEVAASKHPGVHSVFRTDPDKDGEEEVDVYAHQGVNLFTLYAELNELFAQICSEVTSPSSAQRQPARS